jgi:serine/threonine protein kinase
MGNKIENMNEDTSGYLYDEGGSGMFVPENMPSDIFRNISPLGADRKGPFRLLSATRYGKRYLLKCLSPDYRRDPVYGMIQMKEFEIGITLDHPNIRRTVGVEEVAGFGRAMILEYVDGEPLDRALADGRITQENARAVVGQLASAIAYLHTRQIYHRDIKPSNVMVTYAGTQVKLIDFSLSDSGSYVILKNPAGTKRYLAPEQMNVDAKPTTQADIYSFGVVVGEIAAKVGDKELVRIAEVCSATDPADRPESMAQIHIPDPPDLTRTVRGSILDTRWLTVALSVIAGVLILFIGWWTLLRPVEADAPAADDDPAGIQIVDMEKLNSNNNSKL